MYDTSGNVWEWCENEDGLGRRMLRGRSWDGGLGDVQKAFLYGGGPADRVSNIGFRCVRDLP